MQELARLTQLLLDRVQNLGLRGLDHRKVCDAEAWAENGQIQKTPERFAARKWILGKCGHGYLAQLALAKLAERFGASQAEDALGKHLRTCGGSWTGREQPKEVRVPAVDKMLSVLSSHEQSVEPRTPVFGGDVVHGKSVEKRRLPQHLDRERSPRTLR